LSYDLAVIPEPGDHLCVLYDGQADRDRSLLPYLRDGMRAGDKCLVATNDADATGQFADMAGKATRTDQLVVRTGARTGVAALIDLWDSETRGALRDGYGFTRLCAETRCFLPPNQDTDEYQRYEYELDRYLRRHPQSALCLYDMAYFDASLVVAAVTFHHHVVINGLLLENPYHLDVRA
jgi:hypothetical protein